MKAITVRQPWASLIAAGAKTIETRPRRTAYRGRIAIHAGATPYTAADKHTDPALWYRAHDALALERSDGVYDLPYGAVVASAVLTDCVAVENLINEPTCQPAEPWGAGHYIVDLDLERPFGDYSPGRWALVLDDIKPTTNRCPVCWGSAFLMGKAPVCAVAPCPTCGGIGKSSGRRDPIPARGQVTVPWEWTP